MQKDSTADIELNLKKRARRRLVGAIALVLLMMMVLPFLLKDRTNLAPQDEVKITIENETAPPISASVETKPGKSGGDFDSNVTPADSEKNAQPVVLPNQEKSIPENTNESPEAKAQNSKSETAKTETVQLEQSKEDVKQPEEKNAINTNGKFFVQVGVFSDPENVKRLQSKLSELGYQSKTEKMSTDKGEKIRLKSQVFSSRNEAAIALENIKDAGLTGMVVSQ